MKKLLFIITAFFMISGAIMAQNDNERHYRPSVNQNRPSNNNSNYNKTITLSADQYRHSRFIETVRGRYNRSITGRKSSYNRYGEANGARLVWPMAEYSLNSRERGGEYTITVHYKTNKRLLPRDPYILLGINTQNPASLKIRKSSGTVKATFRTNYNKSNHDVKIWLPSEGVEIEKIEVKRKDSGKRR